MNKNLRWKLILILGIVAGACAALVAYGAGFLARAWRLMRVD